MIPNFVLSSSDRPSSPMGPPQVLAFEGVCLEKKKITFREYLGVLKFSSYRFSLSVGILPGYRREHLPTPRCLDHASTALAPCPPKGGRSLNIQSW